MSTTPVQIPWAPGAKYIKLTCRLGEPRPDSKDSDEMPDLMTQAGIVRLVCSAKRIKYTEADGRSRMLTTGEWLFKIRASDGELCNENSQTVGVYVLSGETVGVDPSNFYWTATITPEKGEGWTVTVPSTSAETFDLVEGFITKPSTPGPTNPTPGPGAPASVIRTPSGTLQIG